MCHNNLPKRYVHFITFHFITFQNIAYQWSWCRCRSGTTPVYFSVESFTLQILPGRISVFLFVAGPQVTLGILDLKPGLLFDGRGECVFTWQKKTKDC